MTFLLDANVLVALVVADHVHHDAAETWWAGVDRFATCPITEGALVRFLVREGLGIDEARSVLAGVAASPRHDFWTDGHSYLETDLSRVVGHRQITDAYLASLARAHHERLASFDAGLAAAHPDVATLVPTAP